MSIQKGSRDERELFDMLWEKSWAVVRSAGSGSTQKPSPDLIASNGKRTVAIECKAIKASRKYFPKEEVSQLTEFSMGFGAEPWIGMRFDKLGWFFIHIDDIPESKGDSYTISLDFAKKHGLKFEELIGEYRQKRLKAQHLKL